MRPKPPKQIILSTVDMAEVLGISVRRLNMLGRDGTLKRTSNYRWDRDKTLQAYQDSVASTRKGPIPKVVTVRRGDGTETEGEYDPESGNGNGNGSYRPTPGSRIEADIRKLSAEGRLKEIQLRERAGELVEVVEVQRVWSSQIASIKNSLLLLPAKLAPKLAATDEVLEAQAILDKSLRQVLTELSQYVPPQRKGNAA